MPMPSLKRRWRVTSCSGLLRAVNGNREFRRVRRRDPIIQRSSDYISEAGYQDAVNRDLELTINSLATEMLSAVLAEAGVKGA